MPKKKASKQPPASRFAQAVSKHVPIKARKPGQRDVVVRPKGVKPLRGTSNSNAPLRRPGDYKRQRGDGRQELFHDAPPPPPEPPAPTSPKEAMQRLVDAMSFRTLPLNGEAETVNLKVKYLNALAMNMGIASPALAIIGRSAKTVTEWMKTDEVFAEAVAMVDDIQLDLGEQALLKRVQAGSDQAIIFYLKTKGRKRGYEERQTVNLGNEGGSPFRIASTHIAIEDLVREVPPGSVRQAIDVVAEILPALKPGSIFSKFPNPNLTAPSTAPTDERHPAHPPQAEDQGASAA